MNRCNIGCGQTPIDGWSNYDNSWSVRLAKAGFIISILRWLGFVTADQDAFIRFSRTRNIRWADAVKQIPEMTHTVDVLYSSHMLEHLDRREAEVFLREARRVLKSGGIIRLAVPDIRYHVELYMRNQDADQFIEGTWLGRNTIAAWKDRVRWLFVGDRAHKWMYDGKSLCRLLTEAGFRDAKVVEAGKTTIPEPGALDLHERFPESVYVEAVNA
jgi:SAM-dependent methyltransferase